MLVDVWRYRQDECWEELKPKGGKSPIPRIGHASIYADDEFGHRVYIFGGEYPDGTSSKYLGDLWAFDVVKHLWYEMVGYGGSPIARSYAAMAVDSSGPVHRVYVFGGTYFRGHSYIFLNDLWVYDLATISNPWGGNWMQIKCTSEICPRGLAAAGLAAMNGMVSLFGGRNRAGEVNDLWFMNVTNRGVWEGHTFSSVDLAPSRRADLCFGWEESNDMVYVMAGYGEGIFYEDVWRFKRGMTLWEDMSPDQDPTVQPDPERPNTGKPRRRSHAACALSQSRFWMYGGMDRDMDEMPDMWMYDFRVVEKEAVGGL